MDAITLLRNDHQTIEKLFKEFEKAGDQAFVKKRDIVDRFTEELSVHAVIEEQVFYPVVRATVPDTEDIALESLEEHHVVKWVLDELTGMDAKDERFDAKVYVLMENVRHHVREEEDELFPMVRDELGRHALQDLGDALETARRFAPTHPHPRSPDTPPANVVVGAAASVTDRIGDTMSGVAQGSVNAVGDVIALVLRRKKPQVHVLGTKTTRSTAKQVRDEVSDATEQVIETAQAARRVGQKATRQTRRKVSSAEKRAKRTAGEAKRGTAKTVSKARAGARSTVDAARNGAKASKNAAQSAASSTGRSAAKAASSTSKAASNGNNGSRNGSKAKPAKKSTAKSGTRAKKRSAA